MFVLGKQYGAFFCEVDRNDFHKNIACLIVFSETDDITVTDKSGESETGSSVLIRPLIEHKISCASPVWQIYVSPYSSFAVRLYELAGDSGISAVPPKVLPFDYEMSKEEIFSILDTAIAESNNKIDSRLASILEELELAGPQACLTEIAQKYELSPSRLRTIAKEQIGVPLSMLIVFRKSVKAMKALSLGSSLSEAAHAGGFSDQAHFTRTTRQMFGTTPSSALAAFDYEK